jgi:protein-disulfide isomerase
MQTETKTNYSTPIAIVLAGIIIAGAMYFSDGKKAVAPDTDLNQSVVNIKNVKADSEPFIGNPNAPVVMAVWFDYQCPACQYNEQNLISPLVDEYVKTGKLKIIFKDFAFLSPQSQVIAVAGRAVWEAYPDKFYDWHKFILLNQGKTVSVTDYPGIDKVIIEKMIAEKTVSYQEMVDADKVEGVKFGVNATPSFILGDKLYVGVPQYDVVKQMIDSLLK